MEEYSNCCTAGRLFPESDLCSDCLEHADFEEEEEDQEYTKLRSKRIADWWAEYKINHKKI